MSSGCFSTACRKPDFALAKKIYEDNPCEEMLKDAEGTVIRWYINYHQSSTLFRLSDVAAFRMSYRISRLGYNILRICRAALLKGNYCFVLRLIKDKGVKLTFSRDSESLDLDLIIAAFTGSIDSITLLLDAGADVKYFIHATSSHVIRASEACILANHLPALKLLVARGAECTIPTWSEEICSHPEMITYLTANFYPDENSDLSEFFFNIVRSENIAALKNFLEHPCFSSRQILEYDDYNHYINLASEVLLDQREMLDLILSNGIDLKFWNGHEYISVLVHAEKKEQKRRCKVLRDLDCFDTPKQENEE